LLRAFLAAALSLTAPILIHEQRHVGAYDMEVGWQSEPPFAGIQNAVQILIKDAKGNPVSDLGDPPTLKVQVINGTQTSDPLDLRAAETPGEFDAAIVPTLPGNYTFHLTGSVKGQNIDEKFTSSETTFDPVKDPSEVEFPAKTPSPAQLAQSIDRLNPRIDAATKAAKSAKDSASTAKTLSIVGIVLGGLGLVVGGLAWRRR
jgi:hypothetical protein